MPQKEFTLMCHPPNKRPRQITDAMAREVALQIAADLIRSHDFEAGMDTAIADDVMHVTRYNRMMDGYELARDLERCHHWSPDAQLVDVLDGFSSGCSSLLCQAEKQWGIENPMNPLLPVGTIIKASKGTGVIDGVYEYLPAYYTVKVDRLTNGHELIRFEDAVTVEQ